ncbi:competence/damage-inducible protein A [bacterium]|nr:MAG: competence/damage-inducible protein A [bacterium]
MPAAELVAIGTELLLGDLTDTNSRTVAAALNGVGIDVYATHGIGDNVDRQARLLETVLARADLAVCTGGLGPTVDDVTRDAVARVVDKPLELREDSLHAIEARFAAMGRTMTANNRVQAMLPRDAVVLENPHGTAPGFVARRADGKVIACMPGVPREMHAMLDERLIPWLVEHFRLTRTTVSRSIHTIGWGESQLDQAIRDLFESQRNPTIAMLAHFGWSVDVKLTARAGDRHSAIALLDELEERIRQRVHHGIYGVDEQTLAGAIGTALEARTLSLAVAESCTGGTISADLVAVPGISRVYAGGVTAYGNEAKVSMLRVREETLRAYGAVSEQTAVEMAAGVRRVLGTSVGLSTTGVAGPEGGSAEKPVGLVWVALAMPDRTVARRLQFPGTRAEVIRRASTAALALLWRALEGEA